MTKSKLSRKRRRTTSAVSDQASRIVNVLARWCEQAPGRSFRVERTSEGWTARLDERRSSTGSTALDALAQVAVVASFEAAEKEGAR